LLRLDGFTDTLPDFIGPIDGSAELTIFTEGNHYPVLLPLVLHTFPDWCTRTGACRIDARALLIVTLPQAMIRDMLMQGGARLGNAVLPVGRQQRIFPDFVMGGEAVLRQLAAAEFLTGKASVFARHKGLGLLVKRSATDIEDLAGFAARTGRLVIATESEAAARKQYLATLDKLIGTDARIRLLAREVGTFAGRVGIQHRDVPYAMLNGLADGGVLFSHLAAFYARSYPDRLRYVPVAEAEAFGQEIAIAKTTKAASALAQAFERFFAEAALTAYPSAGFSAPDKFVYGRELDFTQPPP
jgi:hypothetical protein